MTEKSRSKFRNGWIQRLNSYDKGVCLSQSLTFLPPFCLLLFCLILSPMRKALGFTPFQLHIQQKRRDSLPPGLKESPRIRCHWPSLHHVHTPQPSLGSGLQQTLLKLGQSEEGVPLQGKHRSDSERKDRMKGREQNKCMASRYVHNIRVP